MTLRFTVMEVGNDDNGRPYVRLESGIDGRSFVMPLRECSQAMVFGKRLYQGVDLSVLVGPTSEELKR